MLKDGESLVSLDLAPMRDDEIVMFVTSEGAIPGRSEKSPLGSFIEIQPHPVAGQPRSLSEAPR